MKTWKVELTVTVSENWIDDGFELTEREQEIKDCFHSMLPYAYGNEVSVDVRKIELKKHIPTSSVS